MLSRGGLRTNEPRNEAVPRDDWWKRAKSRRRWLHVSSRDRPSDRVVDSWSPLPPPVIRRSTRKHHWWDHTENERKRDQTMCSRRAHVGVSRWCPCASPLTGFVFGGPVSHRVRSFDVASAARRRDLFLQKSGEYEIGSVRLLIADRRIRTRINDQLRLYISVQGRGVKIGVEGFTIFIWERVGRRCGRTTAGVGGRPPVRRRTCARLVDPSIGANCSPTAGRPLLFLRSLFLSPRGRRPPFSSTPRTRLSTAPAATVSCADVPSAYTVPKMRSPSDAIWLARYRHLEHSKHVIYADQRFHAAVWASGI